MSCYGHKRLSRLLFGTGYGQRIEGEVYDVDNAMMATLDGLEGHPDFYLRRKIAVTPIDESDPLTVDGTWVSDISRSAGILFEL